MKNNNQKSQNPVVCLGFEIPKKSTANKPLSKDSGFF